MTALHPNMPALPPRMTRLPLDHRGYPVPWFVAWMNPDGSPAPRGKGTPDHRVVAGGAIETALNLKTCWLCGEPLGAFKTFVIGPMCAVNRISSEPPSHHDCADFAARACPFLTRPKQRRRTNDLPEEGSAAAGVTIERNPGVTLVWTTKSFKLKRVPGDGYAHEGVLFAIGDPARVRWYREARPATREEILESIDSGYPILRGMAERGGPDDVAELAKMYARAMRLVQETANA